MSPRLSWTQNIWMGVSVEEADLCYRIFDLVSTGAMTKFISFEPLLGPIPEAPLEKIEWVIAGGESGPNARPMKKDWATSIRERAGVPYFFKQWGGKNKKAAGRKLDGRTWDQMPLL